MATAPTDSEVELGEIVEREGRETLLPSVTRTVLSTSVHAGALADGSRPPATAEDRRAARAGDVIDGRYVVDGQLGRGGMGRVLRVRHQALGKAFALKLIRSAIAPKPMIRARF